MLSNKFSLICKEDRNTIVLQGDGFIAVGRISAQCDMDAKVMKLIQSRATKI